MSHLVEFSARLRVQAQITTAFAPPPPFPRYVHALSQKNWIAPPPPQIIHQGSPSPNFIQSQHAGVNNKPRCVPEVAKVRQSPVTTNHQAPRTSTRDSWRPMVSSEGGTGCSTMGAERLELALKSALPLTGRGKCQPRQQSARNCPFTTRGR